MKRIPLTQGKYAVVDDEDYDLLNQWKWHYDKGYACRTSKKISMHRTLMGFPADKLIDHINGDTLDNRRSNLRIVSYFGNTQNAKIRKDNTTGVKGVYFIEKYHKWRVRIQANGVRHFIGDYSTLQMAEVAQKRAEYKHHKEFARAK